MGLSEKKTVPGTFLPLILLTILFMGGCKNEGLSREIQDDSTSSLSSATGDSIQEKLAPVDIFIPKNLPDHVLRDIDGKNFKLSPQSFPREKVADFQIAGTDRTKTPKDLQGIWWMEGNLACSCTTSFANVDFSLPLVYMSNFSENNFAYFGGAGPGDAPYDAGTASFNQAASNSAVYEFHFEGKGENRYKKANIYPVIKVDIMGFEIAFRVKPSLLKFRFTKIDDDLYLRENFVLGVKVPGKGGEYRFKRILKPSDVNQEVLEKTKHWNEFLATENHSSANRSGPPALQRLPELIKK